LKLQFKDVLKMAESPQLELWIRCRQERVQGKRRLNTKRIKICGLVLMSDFL